MWSSTVAVPVSLHFTGFPWLAFLRASAIIFSLSLELSWLASQLLLMALKEKWQKNSNGDGSRVTFPVRLVHVTFFSLNSLQRPSCCWHAASWTWNTLPPEVLQVWPWKSIYISAKRIMVAELLSTYLVLCICVRAAWCQQTVLISERADTSPCLILLQSTGKRKKQRLRRGTPILSSCHSLVPFSRARSFVKRNAVHSDEHFKSKKGEQEGGRKYSGALHKQWQESKNGFYCKYSAAA